MVLKQSRTQYNSFIVPLPEIVTQKYNQSIDQLLNAKVRIHFIPKVQLIDMLMRCISITLRAGEGRETERERGENKVKKEEQTKKHGTLETRP